MFLYIDQSNNLHNLFLKTLQRIPLWKKTFEGFHHETTLHNRGLTFANYINGKGKQGFFGG
jgi:hypothetical protein